MKKNLILIITPIFFLLIFLTQKASSQSMEVRHAAGFDVSIPLRDMQPAPVTHHFLGKWKKGEEEHEVPNKFRQVSPIVVQDNAVQTAYNNGSHSMMSAPVQNFAGMTNANNSGGRVTPPDPAGDVGPNHYVQVVNSMLQIFSKTGTSLYGPVTTSTLWNGFSGNWTGHNDGDAIVIYDENADRWVISQFAVDCTGTPYTEYELVAVSTTPDPTGTYYRYAFAFDYMPDYPKMGVWVDGYYLAVNRFNTNTTGPFVGAGAAVMDRTKMLAGDAGATMQYFKTETLGGSGSAAGSACWAMLPSDCDGTFPAAGTPNYFAYIPSTSASQLRIWALHADWTTPANSTFTYVTALSVTAYTALATNTAVSQSGTTQKLDGLGDRLMFRNQYRNFGTYESFVTCHNVTVSSTPSIRWYEYRRTSGTFSLYQQSTYAPGDGKGRWMGSIAQNANGDIGLAYSVCSSSMFPSIYYTGRKAADAINTMTIAEGIIQTGNVAMTGASRWGDYSAVNIDPSDNNTFWTTQEYVGGFGGTWPWATKIASFKFGNNPSVTTSAASPIGSTTATLNGNVNPNGLATTYHFEYGLTTSYGTSTTATSAGSGSSGVAVTANITGLTPGSTYHFRLVAVNSDGTTNGGDLSFNALITPPTVTTTTPSAITALTASSGGNVTSAGDATVTARGVCWSTTANPLITDSHTTDGTGTGTFISAITGLTPNTIYHVRAYATNTGGTSYGSDIQFTSLVALPTVTTTTPTSIYSTSASSGGNVTYAGGGTITARGVCWATTANPDLTASFSSDGSGTGAFISTITGLTASTLYHVRAYATNGAGTSYGSDLQFTTTVLPTLAVTPANQDVPSTAGSTSFAVTSNSVWTASSDQAWCTVTSSGSGNGTITANYTANSLASRTANVTVTVGGLTPIVVTVTQAGSTPTLSVAPSNQAVVYTAGSTSFTVTSNASWSASSDQAWCTVTASGSGSGTITANFTQNNTFVTRVANVTVTVASLIPVVVTVTQDAAPVPEFMFTMVNDVQVSDKILEFDLYLLDSSPSTSFELASIQAGILVNSAIYGGGTITASIIAGSSSLNTAQTPSVVSFVQTQNCIKLAPKSPPGAGAGTIIGTTGQGTKVCRLRLTNSVSFASAQANLTFNFTTSPYPAKVFQYVGGQNLLQPSNATDCFSNCTNPILNPPLTTVNMTVFLEGLYSGGGTMVAASDENGTHWGATIADKITVELHSSSAYSTVVYSTGAINLLTNGTATFTVPNSYTGSYYVTVKHRNSITTVSGSPVSFSSSPVTYNFSDNSSKAYAGNMQLMADGKYAIFGGDASVDGLIDGTDLSLVDNDASAFVSGYVLTDVNGDGLIDGSDLSVVDNNANAFVGVATP